MTVNMTRKNYVRLKEQQYSLLIEQRKGTQPFKKLSSKRVENLSSKDLTTLKKTLQARQNAFKKLASQKESALQVKRKLSNRLNYNSTEEKEITAILNPLDESKKPIEDLAENDAEEFDERISGLLNSDAIKTQPELTNELIRILQDLHRTRLEIHEQEEKIRNWVKSKRLTPHPRLQRQLETNLYNTKPGNIGYLRKTLTAFVEKHNQSKPDVFGLTPHFNRETLTLTIEKHPESKHTIRNALQQIIPLLNEGISKYLLEQIGIKANDNPVQQALLVSKQLQTRTGPITKEEILENVKRNPEKAPQLEAFRLLQGLYKDASEEPENPFIISPNATKLPPQRLTKTHELHATIPGYESNLMTNNARGFTINVTPPEQEPDEKQPSRKSKDYYKRLINAEIKRYGFDYVRGTQQQKAKRADEKFEQQVPSVKIHWNLSKDPDTREKVLPIFQDIIHKINEINRAQWDKAYRPPGVHQDEHEHWLNTP